VVILIGGTSHSGKTFLAQQLLEKYHYPYLSLDHLKMGLCRADMGIGIKPDDSTEFIGEKLWPILKGIIMTNIENQQNLIIEGSYLLPNKINELDIKYLDHIVSFYLGFSPSYIEKYFEAKILEFRDIIETRGYENNNTIEDYLLENKRQKDVCETFKAKYFALENDYQKEMEAVYAWLENEISQKVN
jgi:putative acetyltransferase